MSVRIFFSLLCVDFSGSGQKEIPAVPGGLGICFALVLDGRVLAARPAPLPRLRAQGPSFRFFFSLRFPVRFCLGNPACFVLGVFSSA